MDKEFTPDEVIDALGGTSKVADLCEVSASAVAQWRNSRNGIPKPQLKFLRMARPSIFKALVAAKAITSPALVDSKLSITSAAATSNKLAGEAA